jgi:hypothetical protein
MRGQNALCINVNGGGSYSYRFHGLYGKGAAIVMSAPDLDEWILGEGGGMSDSSVCSWFGALNCSVETHELAPIPVRLSGLQRMLRV